MNWEYELVFSVYNESGHILRVEPKKFLKSDTGEILTETKVSTLEFATSVADNYIDSYFTDMHNRLKNELAFLFTYDPDSQLETMGASAQHAGNSFGYTTSIILEIGTILIARKRGTLNV